MKKVLIATYPFGQCGRLPIEILEKSGIYLKYNSLGRRLKGNEVEDMIEDVDGVIAGTEPYTYSTIEKAKNLKVIARVGVGLDNVDFEACKQKNIILTYTPEAPADGVADLAVAQIINLLRGIVISDKSIRNGMWNRFMGFLLAEKKIGILGVGRIGRRVIQRLQPFNTIIYACDIKKIENIDNVIWVDKQTLFSESDIISIHIPMNKENYHCVGMKEMSSMKEGSFLVNTSRGPVINEEALLNLLYSKHIAGAALDVFEKEPYIGPLTELNNVILTAHIGASSHQSRFNMELGAAEDCIRVLNREKPLYQVTDKTFYE